MESAGTSCHCYCLLCPLSVPTPHHPLPRGSDQAHRPALPWDSALGPSLNPRLPRLPLWEPSTPERPPPSPFSPCNLQVPSKHLPSREMGGPLCSAVDGHCQAPYPLDPSIKAGPGPNPSASLALPGPEEVARVFTKFIEYEPPGLSHVPPIFLKRRRGSES